MDTSRTRSETSLVPTYVTARATTTSGTPVAAPYNQDQVYGSGGTVGYNNVISDEAHKNFAKRKKRGEIIMGAMQLSKWSRAYTPSSLQVVIPSWGNERWNWNGDLAIGLEQAVNRVGKLPDTIGDVSLIKNVAVIKAHAKINESSIMSGEILSDLGKTVSTLRHPFRSASQLVEKMINHQGKRLKKSGSNFAQATADTWLENRYGWTPILLDAMTIVKESHRIRESAARSMVVRASEVSNSTFRASVANVAGSENLSGFLYDGTAVSVIEISAHCGLIVRVENLTTSDSLLQFFGLRTVDIPATLLEVVPYSFVVDWFLGVGPWVSALTPNPGVTITRSWVTTKYRKNIEFSGVSYRSLGGVMTNKGSCSSVTTHDIVARILDPGIPPLPVVQVNSLPLRNALDAAALLTRPILGGLRKLFHS